MNRCIYLHNGLCYGTDKECTGIVDCPNYIIPKVHEENSYPEFKSWNKIARLNRDIIITEKIDGSNGVIYIDENNNFYVGSRKRWLDEHNENMGFYHWAMENKEELLKLGKGYHYGEWMGKGIQRNYGLNEKRFYLFNTMRWIDIYTLPESARKKYRDEYLNKIREDSNNDKLEYCPECCYVVPILYQGSWFRVIDDDLEYSPNWELMKLRLHGSKAIEGFMKPEGIVIYHKASGISFKVTLENDEKPKCETKE
jgi:hypothetical protein